MNATEFTARKLASADRAAQDQGLTDLDFRLLWLLLSAADRSTGIVRRKQSNLAQMLGITRRGVQISRDRLVGFGYIEPVGVKPGGYVSSYNVVTSRKANLYSPSEKGEPTFASENKKANGGDQKGERLFQKGEPPFAPILPLISLDVPSRAREPSFPDGLGPLGAELRKRIKPTKFVDWFVRGQAELVSQTPDAVTIAVRTKFFRDQIRNRFESDILACVPGVARVEFVVREAGTQ
jgi:DnaA N-terminal domain